VRRLRSGAEQATVAGGSALITKLHKNHSHIYLQDFHSWRQKWKDAATLPTGHTQHNLVQQLDQFEDQQYQGNVIFVKVKPPVLIFQLIQINNQANVQGAPYREIYATEAIGDLPHVAVQGCQYNGPPTNPFQAKARAFQNF
jgi:hypothetical protein